jgi:hypothetical protein
MWVWTTTRERLIRVFSFSSPLTPTMTRSHVLHHVRWQSYKARHPATSWMDIAKMRISAPCGTKCRESGVRRGEDVWHPFFLSAITKQKKLKTAMLKPPLANRYSGIQPFGFRDRQTYEWSSPDFRIGQLANFHRHNSNPNFEAGTNSVQLDLICLFHKYCK